MAKHSDPQAALFDLAAQLEKAGTAHDVAQASVMGPAAIRAMRTEAASPAFWQRHGGTTGKTAKQVMKIVFDKIVAPNLQKGAKMSRRTIDNARVKVLEKASVAATSHSHIRAATKKYDSRMQVIIKMSEAIDDAQEKVKDIDNAIKAIGLRGQAGTTFTPLLPQDAAQIRSLKELKDISKSTITECEDRIFELFDERLGGVKAARSNESKKLELPADLENATTREIHDALRTYMLAKVIQFYTVIPVIDYMFEAYDADTGMFPEPPSITSQYATVDESVRTSYAKQSRAIFCDILSVIKDAKMTQVIAKANIGKYHTEICQGHEDDGPMAVYCMISKYGKCDSYNKDDVEEIFNQAAHHFAQGRPANKVNFLREKLTEAIRLDVHLKANQTVMPIVEALQERHYKFQNALQPFEQGGPNPENCTLYMQDLFMVIENTTKSIERLGGGKDMWGSHTDAKGFLARVEGPYKRAKLAYKESEPFRGRGRDKDKNEYRRGQGREKGPAPHSRISKGIQKTERCKKAGCQEKAVRGRNFCLTCWRKGMEDGRIKMFTGEMFEMDKASKDAEKNAKQRKRAALAKKAKREAKKEAEVNKAKQEKDTIARIAKLEQALNKRKRKTRDEDSDEGEFLL